MIIQIFQIKVNGGRREIDTEAVHRLAESISEVGLLNPITVDQEFTLIAGLHRLEAAKLLGWTEIKCNVSCLDGLLSQLAEIDENLIRRDLDCITQGEWLNRRKEIYENLYPETKNGGDRKSEKIRTRAARSDRNEAFSTDTAGKIGISKRTIQENIQLAKDLSDKAKKIIKEAPEKVKKKDMLKLSRLPPDQQEEAANQLATGAIRSVEEYHSAQAETEFAEEQDTKPLEALAPPVPGTGYYPTIKDSVADLKNPDKDRSLTPDTFLITFSLFLQRFCQNVKSYTVNEYEPVFPALTRKHLDQIQTEICSVHAALDTLFKIIERKSKQ